MEQITSDKDDYVCTIIVIADSYPFTKSIQYKYKFIIMKKENFLIIGGTGKTGRKVVESLELLNQNVRVGSRSSQPAFDWNNEDTWEDVLEGMDKMYITYQPDLAVPGAKQSIENLIALAQKKNLKKVVLLSGKGEREAELCEQVVIHSGFE